MRAFGIVCVVAFEVCVNADPVHFTTANYLLFADNWNIVLRLAGYGARIATDAIIEVDRHSPGVIQLITLIFVVK